MKSAGGLLLAMALVAPSASTAAGHPFVNFGATSKDGKSVFFSTPERLVPGDTDDADDVYRRLNDSFTLLSTGPSGGNGAFGAFLAGISVNGSRVFFETRESLVPSDEDSCFQDGCWDAYQRFRGTTTLLSTGPFRPNSNEDSYFDASSVDGTRVFLTTSVRLVAADEDRFYDLYERSFGTTKLVSVGPLGDDDGHPNFTGASSDGRRVFFETDTPLVRSDSDRCGLGTCEDIYERLNGKITRLVSTGPLDTPVSPGSAFFGGASADGRRVIFETSQPLVLGDNDAMTDVYERAGGTTTLISTGSLDGMTPATGRYFGQSRDGSNVFFETAARLEPEDHDSCGLDQDDCDDVYERSDGVTRLVSTGPNEAETRNADFAGASADGSRVFFMTRERLVPGDVDGRRDLYMREGGETTRLSRGPTGGNGPFDVDFTVGSSLDGERVFFLTSERLVPADHDECDPRASRRCIDVYERAGDVTRLVSTGPSSGATRAASFEGSSADGSRVFFSTAEPLVSFDKDDSSDIYERFAGITTLISGR